jgi:hypothetical protein
LRDTERHENNCSCKQTFNLKRRHVKHSDAGRYICTLADVSRRSVFFDVTVTNGDAGDETSVAATSGATLLTPTLLLLAMAAALGRLRQ